MSARRNPNPVQRLLNWVMSEPLQALFIFLFIYFLMHPGEFEIVFNLLLGWLIKIAVIVFLIRMILPKKGSKKSS